MRTKKACRTARAGAGKKLAPGARKRAARATKPLEVLTIGHSTLPIEEFIGRLLAHGVTRLIDIRTVPKSRNNPQFGIEQLPSSLRTARIGYEHWPALGGLRKTSAASINTAWRNLSFRGYADHMQTKEFADAIAQLIELAEEARLVLMCAEGVPWRCHRSLVADALIARGVACSDIRSTKQLMPHRLTPFARVRGRRVTYPADAGAGGPLG